MFWEVIISGLLLGGISSFHCVGMCGPLALSLPVAHLAVPGRVNGILLYNLGRAFTYAELGLLFGFLGRQVSLSGFQQVFSIAAGITILLSFALTILHKRFPGTKAVNHFYIAVQSLVARFLRKKSTAGFLLTGMANGLLPCGMVYLAITGAMATGTPVHGMTFMAAFGLGTIPAMFLLSLAGFVVSMRARGIVRRLTPFAFLFMGLLLVLRGMELGIPFISPFLPANS
ncbi:MAG TPA: sulfite exporter TauE/SafE family protein, partial [Chitinophagaceae bacterium]